MTTIAATIQDVHNVSGQFSGHGAREVYLLACDFAAYTGASDDAAINGIGAAINASTRDGKTRTLRWVCTAHAGVDTNKQAVYAAGASVQALAVSGDNATGNLANAADTELTSATASTGVGVLVGVDVS